MFSDFFDELNRKKIFTEEDDELRKNYRNHGNLICRYQNLEFLEVDTDWLYIDCSLNTIHEIRNLNLASNLISLECQSNNLTSIHLEGLTELKSLNCSMNQLQEITALDCCTKLVSLNCYMNHLVSLDLNGLTKLMNLSCYANQLLSLIHISEPTRPY